MTENSKLNARLTIKDKSYEFPIVTGTELENGIDITSLRSQTGCVTLDDGYMNTGSCQSSVTYLDGEKGILRYRGYSIEDLAEKSCFLEVSYLLIKGDLPSKTELEQFKLALTKHTLLHEDLKRFFDAFPRDAHPMALLSSVVCSLSTFYQDSLIPGHPEHLGISITRLLAKIPTIAAYSYKKSIGHPLVYPDNSLSYTANFMKMMFSVPCEPYEVDEDVANALDALLILHADHEQNCSASTVRMVGSSRANLYAAISAGICALWGPLHGGANQKVLEMLLEINNSGASVQSFIQKAKDKDSTFRLMGFGHRVYKNYDPRARIIKKHCDNILKKMGVSSDPLLEIAKELEETALKDDYFVERKLYPNVDFYSGIIYRSLGIPVNMFTVLFAIGRMPGWIAQYKEMLDTNAKIGRPRQIYQGHTKREYKSITER